MPLLDTLHLIAVASPLARNFHGLSNSTQEHWLLPLDVSAIGQIDWSLLLKAADARKIPQFGKLEELQGGINQRVLRATITAPRRGGGEGVSWMQEYDDFAGKINRDLGGGNALDIRIWPNFCLPVVPRVPEPAGDRVYFFRIRQQPEWGLRPLVFARVRNDDGRVRGYELLQMDANPALPGPQTNFRQAEFYSLSVEGARLADGSDSPGHAEPIGLYFERRGLLLFLLPVVQQLTGAPPVPWRVGVDFGTSNTCVTFLSLVEGLEVEPKAAVLDTQTATLHEAPTYSLFEMGDESGRIEGAASTFDFPYRHGREELLTERYYFPSQLITRLKEGEAPRTPDFHFDHGFIFPRNGALDNVNARDLLAGHPPAPARDHRVFRLVQDLKWSNRSYRRAFLWHLYKLLVYHAARRGARITEAVFSYPRAFDVDSVNEYRNEIAQIFQHHGGIRVRKDGVMSESLAVQRRVQARAPHQDRLVLDVGGGTTDYTALLVGAPAFQASYCLAGSYLNEYFRASAPLRGVLHDTALLVPGSTDAVQTQTQRRLLRELLAALNKSPAKGMTEEKARRLISYNQAAFFGLLTLLNDEQLTALPAQLLREEAPNAAEARPALLGFFLTITVLYAAVVYQGARMLRQQRPGLASLGLEFIGNGSRYLLFLNGAGRPGRFLLERLVQAVLPPPQAGALPVEVRLQISPEGKAWVAEGLVIAAGDSTPAVVCADEAAGRQYAALRAGQDLEKVVPLTELDDFLRLLGELLPGGKLRMPGEQIRLAGGRFKQGPERELVVVPFSPPNLAVELAPWARRAVQNARGEIQERAYEWADLQQKAEEFKGLNDYEERANREAANALEPVFITCVRQLLDEIRRHYTGSQ